MYIHVWYSIYTYIYHKNQPNVGKYTSPMDPSWVRNQSLTWGRNKLFGPEVWPNATGKWSAQFCSVNSSYAPEFQFKFNGGLLSIYKSLWRYVLAGSFLPIAMLRWRIFDCLKAIVYPRSLGHASLICNWYKGFLVWFLLFFGCFGVSVYQWFLGASRVSIVSHVSGCIKKRWPQWKFVLVDFEFNYDWCHKHRSSWLTCL